LAPVLWAYLGIRILQDRPISHRILARSTAVVVASSPSFEPSVARSTLVGKLLISYTS
jgi:hypothetical protein